MTPAELNRLSSLLDVGLELTEAERDAWLRDLHGEEAVLAPRLRALLERHANVETGELLERVPAFTVAGDAGTTSSFLAGERVGPYRLEREIGQGGMGEVWLAVRDDGVLKRQVALKLPMVGARRAVLVQRFARERDILGSLAHPHIARLYDAGLADDGQPYLALEFVEGRPVTDHARERGLDTRARVRLLRQVLDAVQYAHANLVIHRDLKPSNVLVTADGHAMLLDFGIAKLLQEDASQAAETELTRLGGRAMTLAYAAPEQINGAPISIATDVWALGVLLQEVLTGVRPFTGTPRELEHAIVNDEPARPTGLPSDLATIVQKALKKPTAERYATVDAFAADLDRWLDGKPVLAQPDRLGYRLRKFVWRHRVPVGASALAALALVASSAVAIVQAVEARRQAAVAREQAELARQEATRAHAVQGFLTDLFTANTDQQADPQRARQATARELLDRGATRVDKALAESPQGRLEVMGTLADMYTQLGVHDQASALQKRRIELARSVYGGGNVKLADVLLSYIETLQDRAGREEIPPLLAEATAVLDKAGDDRSDLRGFALLQTARFFRHESIRQARESADAAVAFHVRFHPTRGALITGYNQTSKVRLNMGDAEGAQQQATLGIAAAQRRGEGAKAWLRGPTIELANALQAQMRYGEAEAKLREAIDMSTHLGGADHPSTLTTTIRRANLLLTVGRTAEGNELLDRVRAAMRTHDPRMSAGWRSEETARMNANAAERGRPDLMLAATEADIVDLESHFPNSVALAQTHRLLAELHAALGDAAAARRSMATADALWRKAAAGAEVARMDTRFDLTRARVALVANDPTAALALLDPSHPALPEDAIARDVERARALSMLGRAAEAATTAHAALQTLAALPAGNRPVALQAAALQRRGEALLAQGDTAGARVDLQDALVLRQANDAVGSRWVAALQHELAIARHARSVSPRASGVLAQSSAR